MINVTKEDEGIFNLEWSDLGYLASSTFRGYTRIWDENLNQIYADKLDSTDVTWHPDTNELLTSSYVSLKTIMNGQLSDWSQEEVLTVEASKFDWSADGSKIRLCILWIGRRMAHN